MRTAVGLLLIAAVCFFIYFVAKKGKFKEGGCNGCINCPMKDCTERKDITKD